MDPGEKEKAVPMTKEWTEAFLKQAHEMARQGMSHGDIADAMAERTGLLRTYVVDLLRKHQGMWMTA